MSRLLKGDTCRHRKPPAKERCKGRVQQPEIETENDHATGTGRPRGERLVHQRPHNIPSVCKHDQRNDRQREHEAEHHLADDQRLCGIEAQHDHQDGRDHRHQTPYPNGNGEAHKALHDHLPGQRADGGTGKARGQERDRKDETGSSAQQGRQRLVGGGDIGHATVSMCMEGRCRHVEHRHIDQSRQAHRQDHIRDAPAKDAPGFLFTARDNPLLGQGGVQVDDMWHHCCPNDPHREEDTLRPPKPGDNRVKAHLPPIRTGEECLEHVTHRNHPNQGRDDGF